MKKGQLKSGAFWSIFGLGGRVILSFFSAPIIISKIGLEGYGIILLLNLYSYNGIIQFLDLGLPLVLQKRFANLNREQLDEEDMIQCGFSLMFILSLISFILLIALTFILPSFFKLGSYEAIFKHNIYLLGFLIICQFLTSFYSSYLMARAEITIVKKWEAIVNIFWTVWSIATVLYYKEHFIAPFLIGNLILNLAMTIYLAKISQIKIIRNFLLFPKSIFTKNFFDLWKSSFLLKLNGLTFKQSDAFIVSLLLSPTGLSLLDISTKFMSLGKTVMGKLNEISFIHFNTQASKDSKEQSESDFFKMLNTQIVFVSFIAFFLVFFTRDILTMWLGKNFNTEVILYVQLSGIILMLVPYAHLLTNFLIATKDDFYHIIMTIAKVSIANIICSVILTHFLGVLGVMISTIIQHIMLEILLLKHASFPKHHLRYHFRLLGILLLFLSASGLIINSIPFGPSNFWINLATRVASFGFFSLLFFVLLIKKDDYFKKMLKFGNNNSDKV